MHMGARSNLLKVFHLTETRDVYKSYMIYMKKIIQNYLYNLYEKLFVIFNSYYRSTPFIKRRRNHRIILRIIRWIILRIILRIIHSSNRIIWIRTIARAGVARRRSRAHFFSDGAPTRCFADVVVLAVAEVVVFFL